MSRTNIDETVTESGSWKQVTVSNLTTKTPVTSTNNLVQPKSSVHTVRVGNVTPGFRTLKTLRNVPAQQFSFLREEIRNIRGGFVYETMASYYGKVDERVTVSGDRIRDFPSEADYEYFSAWPALDREVRSKMLLELKDQKTNLVNMLAERTQTANMLVKTATRLVGAYNSLRRGDYASAAQVLGVNASRSARKRYHQKWLDARLRDLKLRANWDPNVRDVAANGLLELRYGWQPLLQDLYGSVELIAQASMREERNRAHVRVKKQYTSKMKVMGRETTYTHSFLVERRAVVTRQMTIDYAVDQPVVHSLAQVGIINPAVVLWEITPWSFVVDWLIGIGDFLGTLDATFGLVFKRGCTTDSTEYFVTVTSTLPGADNGYHRMVFAHGQGTKRRFQLNRYRLSQFPDVPIPVVKNPMSLVHVENALALLSQTFKPQRK